MTRYELELHETEHPGVSLFEVRGELDLTNAPELEATLVEAGDLSVALVVDLTGVSFLDSRAVQALFRVSRRLQDDGKMFAIALGSDAFVARTLEITGLGRVATMGTSFDDVLSRLEFGSD